MLEWKDVTNSFTEPSRHWKGRYLELCEVAEGKIELSLFSSPHDSWEVYVNYGMEDYEGDGVIIPARSYIVTGGDTK